MSLVRDPHGPDYHGINNTNFLRRVVMRPSVKIYICVGPLPIDLFPLKRKRWKHYVDDTDVVWPHGKE